MEARVVIILALERDFVCSHCGAERQLLLPLVLQLHLLDYLCSPVESDSVVVDPVLQVVEKVPDGFYGVLPNQPNRQLPLLGRDGVDVVIGVAYHAVEVGLLALVVLDGDDEPFVGHFRSILSLLVVDLGSSHQLLSWFGHIKISYFY